MKNYRAVRESLTCHKQKINENMQVREIHIQVKTTFLLRKKNI